MGVPELGTITLPLDSRARSRAGAGYDRERGKCHKRQFGIPSLGEDSVWKFSTLERIGEALEIILPPPALTVSR
jgi:hypothetical protein